MLLESEMMRFHLRSVGQVTMTLMMFGDITQVEEETFQSELPPLNTFSKSLRQTTSSLSRSRSIRTMSEISLCLSNA